MKKLIACLLLLSCSCSTNIKEQYVNNNIKWMMLAPHIKKHFNINKSVEEIAADLAYQEYLIFTK